VKEGLWPRLLARGAAGSLATMMRRVEFGSRLGLTVFNMSDEFFWASLCCCEVGAAVECVRAATIVEDNETMHRPN
jgi:hypothetical protein